MEGGNCLKKTYILDTNVILYSPSAITSFEDNDVIIPECVLEELDNFKKNDNELGANARSAARLIDTLREKGKLTEGVELPGGGKLRVEMNHNNIPLPVSWEKEKIDNRIIQVCIGLKEKGEDVYLITKDIFERIKADTMDINTRDYYEEAIFNKELYTGRLVAYASSASIDEFYSKKYMGAEDIQVYSEQDGEYIEEKLYHNQFVLIYANDNPKKSALGRFDGEKIVPLLYKEESLMGIKPKTIGQKFMMEALMLSSSVAPLVIIKGPAGTGKTLFSLAAGLSKIIYGDKKNNEKFRKILVCRPNITMDEEIGFLPGSEEEKIMPFMRPVFDNLEVLVNQDDDKRYNHEDNLNIKVQELFLKKIITTEAVAYLRGRSIVKNWVIIDEAQNLSPKQIKAIVTRIGEGSKLILIGDPEQIDQPFLDYRSNGLCYIAEKMKGSKLCCQLSLYHEECERSALAYEASQRL